MCLSIHNTMGPITGGNIFYLCGFFFESQILHVAVHLIIDESSTTYGFFLIQKSSLASKKAFRDQHYCARACFPLCPRLPQPRHRRPIQKPSSPKMPVKFCSDCQNMLTAKEDVGELRATGTRQLLYACRTCDRVQIETKLEIPVHRNIITHSAK